MKQSNFTDCTVKEKSITMAVIFTLEFQSKKQKKDINNRDRKKRSIRQQ